MGVTTTIKRWLAALGDVLAPRKCAVCGKVLGADEQWLCRLCLSRLPLTGFHAHPDNKMEQLFYGLVPVERATAVFYYHRGDPYASILHDIKYRNCPKMGMWLMHHYATRVLPADWLDGIDAIVPVPLHRRKLASRGYNQSEYLARGISRACGAPVVLAIKAVKQHATQTHKSAIERRRNVADTFAANDIAPSLAGRHVLLVDDVVTTGSTLEATAVALRRAVPSVTISMMTLASASLD